MKRTNKEIKLNLTELFDISYGSTNKYNPKVIYISCKTWVEPKEEIEFDNVIGNIFTKFKKELLNRILQSDIFNRKFISNFEIKSSSLQKNKKNFFNFEIYLKQKDKVYFLNEL